MTKELTIRQIEDLNEVLELLDQADALIQTALGDKGLDLHYAIQDVMDEVEAVQEDSEMVDN